jgi:hypothetical protein
MRHARRGPGVFSGSPGGNVSCDAGVRLHAEVVMQALGVLVFVLASRD